MSTSDFIIAEKFCNSMAKCPSRLEDAGVLQVSSTDAEKRVLG